MKSNTCYFPILSLGKRFVYLAVIVANFVPVASLAMASGPELSNFRYASNILFRTESGLQSDERLEIPAEKEQREKKKEIKLLFKDLYADRSAKGKKLLANKLLDIAKESNNNPAYQYICLTESIEVATACCSAKPALDAAYLLAEKFDVNDKKIKMDTVEDLARRLSNAEEANNLISRTQPVVVEFTKSHEYKSAAEMTKKMAAAARKFGEGFSASKFERETDRLKKISRSYRSIQTSFQKLEADKDDAEANQVVGEFYCFAVGDFETGTKHLAKGKIVELVEIAELEISNSGTSKEHVEIADLWWDVAAKLDEVGAKSVRQRAGVYYLKEVKKLTGITKATVESRLKEIAGESTIPIEGPWVGKWDNGASWDPIVFSTNGSWTASSSSGLTFKGDWSKNADGLAEIVMKDTAGNRYTLSRTHLEAELRQFRDGKLTSKAVLSLKK